MTANEFGSQLAGLEQNLVKFAYRFNLKKDDIKDLVQETFLKALKNRDKFVDSEKFKTWTFTIMRNIFVDNYRSGAIKKTVSYSANDSIFENYPEPVGTDDPDSNYSAFELNQIIDQLNDTLRIPFRMYVNGYKYIEIAEKLNIKIGTVKKRIFLSRYQLMKKFNTHFK
jgi:RNA polymerase sigma-70 factor (ECF subfamily)